MILKITLKGDDYRDDIDFKRNGDLYSLENTDGEYVLFNGKQLMYLYSIIRNNQHNLKEFDGAVYE